MTIDQAREWVVKVSLGVPTVLFFVVVLGDFLGYPLHWRGGDVLRILEIVVPVFFAYIGTAARFAFRGHALDASGAARKSTDLPNLAQLLIRWPLVLSILMIAVSLVGFGVSNRAAAPPGTGWSVDTLAGAIAIAMLLLGGSTSVAVSYLFPLAHDQSAKK